jgi:ABC-2 type transport system permease protein
VSSTDARIHDIGYRHYEGDRLGAMFARRSLFVHSLRGAYGLGRSARAKVLPVLLFVLMCLPAIVMVAQAALGAADEPLIEPTAYAVLMQPILGPYLALAAPQMVSLDLRYKTIPLYFSRPIDRADYVLAKIAALTAALLIFTGLPLLITCVGTVLAGLDFADQSAGFGRGLAVAAVFSLLHAVIALLIASLTPRRGFGVAAIIAVFTIPYFAVLVIMEVAVTQGREAWIDWLALFSPGTLMDAFQAVIFNGDTDFPAQRIPDGAMAPVYLVAIAGLIALFHHLLKRRYRKAGL